MIANNEATDNRQNRLSKEAKKRASVKQQISERMQILFAPAESDSALQMAENIGLSQDLVGSWHHAGNGGQATDLSRTNGTGQLAKPPNGHSPAHEQNQQHNGYENLEVSGRPIIRQAGRDTVHPDHNTRKVSGQPPHRHTSWNPQRSSERMNDVVELRRVVGTIIRWWWLILLVALAAAAAGFAYTLTVDPVYRASASVIVGQSIQATSLDTRDIQTSERLALSYADIAKRQPILEAVNVSLNLGYTWGDLRKRTRVELVPDTQLLEISVEAGSRDEAIMIADEIARQLILLSPTALQNQDEEDDTLFVRTRLQALRDKIEANQEQLDGLSIKLAAARSVEQKALIQAEMSNLESMILDWEGNYARFLTYVGGEKSANYLAIVEHAHGRFAPIRPVLRLNIIVAATAGLVLALGLIFLLDFLDDTLKIPDDISHDLELIPLGSIAQFSGRLSQERRIAAKDSFSPLTESYRMVRNNIQFMSLDKPGGSILVTSPAPGDGKSVTAVNLAVVMASHGEKTILVDTDLRKPQLHKFFNVANGRGLTNKLLDTESKTQIPLVETNISGLRLLTAGDTPPDPAKLLGSQRMELLIAELMDEADVLIFDSPPASYIADAAVLSQKVDGVVLVVSAGKTRRDVSRQAIFNLHQASANILGVVLNRATAKGGAYKYVYGEEEGRRGVLAGRRIFTGLQRAWSSLTLAIRWRRQEGGS